jgi:hypothetical protein
VRPWVPGCVGVCIFLSRLALLIEHATGKRHFVTSFVTPLVPPYCSTLSHKRHDFRKNVTEYKMCFDILYNFYLKYFSFYEEFSDMPSCKVPVILVTF